MKIVDITTMPGYFKTYIGHLEDCDLILALETTGKLMFESESNQLDLLNNKVYAPGKWTVKDILQHIIDTERIFAYRALRFARADQTPLPGYDETEFANNSFANSRSLNSLLEELYLIRESSILLFKDLSEIQLQRVGICNDNQCQVLALGFAIAGHGVHHLKIIKERYYPLLK